MYRMMWLAVIAGLAAAQTAPAPRDVQAAMTAAAERQRASVRQQMEQGIERQRQSVRKQAQAAIEQKTEAEFFTVPWPAAVPIESASADCEPLPQTEVEALIGESARREDLKPDLLREVMRRESAFRPCAVSRSGALGLMQLMPATAEQFHVSDPFDPKQNVAGGAKFLKTLLTRYGGDAALALGAYNSGPGRVDEAGGVPAIPETRDYVMAILSALGSH